MFVRVIIQMLCECFRCVYRVSGFEPIDRDCVLPTIIECNNKIPFFAINHSEGASGYPI